MDPQPPAAHSQKSSAQYRRWRRNSQIIQFCSIHSHYPYIHSPSIPIYIVADECETVCMCAGKGSLLNDNITSSSSWCKSPSCQPQNRLQMCGTSCLSPEPAFNSNRAHSVVTYDFLHRSTCVRMRNSQQTNKLICWQRFQKRRLLLFIDWVMWRQTTYDRIDCMIMMTQRNISHSIQSTLQSFIPVFHSRLCISAAPFVLALSLLLLWLCWSQSSHTIISHTIILHSLRVAGRYIHIDNEGTAELA